MAELDIHQIVLDYQQMVFSLAFRVLADEQAAKDICQEVFIKIWKSQDKYNSQYKLSTWIYKITYNTCYDYLRSSKNSSISLDVMNGFNAKDLIDSYIESPETKLDNKQLKELILKYTADLSPIQKLVFTLRDIEDLEVEEVCKITGMSAKNIKDNLYQARKNIKAKISWHSYR